jgi:hypothetical protein
MSTLQQSVFWSAVVGLFVLAAFCLASEVLRAANSQLRRSLSVLDDDPGDDYPDDDWAAS